MTPAIKTQIELLTGIAKDIRKNGHIDDMEEGLIRLEEQIQNIKQLDASTKIPEFQILSTLTDMESVLNNLLRLSRHNNRLLQEKNKWRFR